MWGKTRSPNRARNHEAQTGQEKTRIPHNARKNMKPKQTTKPKQSEKTRSSNRARHEAQTEQEISKPKQCTHGKTVSEPKRHNNPITSTCPSACHVITTLLSRYRVSMQCVTMPQHVTTSLSPPQPNHVGVPVRTRPLHYGNHFPNARDLYATDTVVCNPTSKNSTDPNHPPPVPQPGRHHEADPSFQR